MQAGFLTAETFLVGLYAARLSATEHLVSQRAEDARREDRRDPESALYIRSGIQSFFDLRYPNLQKSKFRRLLFRWSFYCVVIAVVAVDTLLAASVLTRAQFDEFTWSPRHLDVPVAASCLLWGISVLVALAGWVVIRRTNRSINAWREASAAAKSSSITDLSKAASAGARSRQGDPTERYRKGVATATPTSTDSARTSVRGALVVSILVALAGWSLTRRNQRINR